MRAQKIEPGGLARVVRNPGPVAENINVEGALGALAYGRNHSARAVRVRCASANRSERTCIGHGRGQRRRRHPGHRCLDDWQIDSQRLEQCHLGYLRVAHAAAEISGVVYRLSAARPDRYQLRDFITRQRPVEAASEHGKVPTSRSISEGLTAPLKNWP